MTVNEPIALPCYEAMAEAYAAAVDAKPFNACYEPLSRNPWFLVIRARRDQDLTGL